MTVPGEDEPDAWSVVVVMMDPVDVGVIVVAVDAAAVAAGDGWATVTGMVSVDELGCDEEIVWPVTGGEKKMKHQLGSA